MMKMEENIIIAIDDVIDITNDDRFQNDMHKLISDKKSTNVYLLLIGISNNKEKLSSLQDNIQIVRIDKQLDKTIMQHIFDDKLKDIINKKSIIDLTYASKTLTILLTIYATRNNLIIRNLKNEISTQQTELTESEQSHYELEDVVQEFNKYQYESALKLLHKSNIKPKEKKKLENFIIFYKHYDCLKYYTPNVNQLLDLEDVKDVSKQIKNNINAIRQFKKKNFTGYSYRIANNISNAHRRMEEEKYQEAILKLVKATEIIALTRLNSYGIDKYYINQEQLVEYNIPDNFIKSIHDNDKLAVNKQYKLLSLLEDNIGKLFIIYKNKGYNIIHIHTQCISNDYKPTKQEVEVYYNITLRLALELNPDIEKYVEETSFPKLEVK